MATLPFANLFSVLSSEDKMLSTRHLTLMFKAGITVTEATSVLAAQSRGGGRRLWQSVLGDLENGSSLFNALSKFPSTFDSFYLSLVRVGEESGTLVENLEFLAKQLDDDLTTKRKLQSALLYPILVLSATILVGGFIALFILPQLVDFFTSFDVELPLSTRLLLVVANFSKNYGPVTALILAGIFVTLAFLVGTPLVRPFWDRLVLRFPIVGHLISLGQLARFCRNLGILLKSGLPVAQAIDITGQTMSNLAYRGAAERLSEAIKEGTQLSATLASVAGFAFPPLAYKMIGVGERTGNLDETLLYLAAYFDEEIDTTSKNFVTLLEPVLLLGIGLLVAFVALAIIGPIYGLIGNLRAQ